MILIQHTMSAQSRFVRLLLAEHDIDAELADERPWERRPEFLQVNPAGTLPVLYAEANTPICGYYAIAEYLDETRGIMLRDRRLMPEYPLDRAEARRLTDWFMVKFDADVTRVLVRERVFKLEMPADRGGGAPDSGAMRASRANIKQHIAYINWLAGTRNWLTGGKLTIADFAAAGAISILDYLGELDWRDAPHARDWYGRMKSRPSFRPILSERVRGLQPASHYADLDF
ncbi:MAG: glutathione S-transferase family protein [Pseudomonadota bacterium]